MNEWIFLSLFSCGIHTGWKLLPLEGGWSSKFFIAAQQTEGVGWHKMCVSYAPPSSSCDRRSWDQPHMEWKQGPLYGSPGNLFSSVTQWTTCQKSWGHPLLSYFGGSDFSTRWSVFHWRVLRGWLEVFGPVPASVIAFPSGNGILPKNSRNPAL